MNLYCDICQETTECDWPSNVIGPPAYGKYNNTETENFYACTQCEAIISFKFEEHQNIDAVNYADDSF